VKGWKGVEHAGVGSQKSHERRFGVVAGIHEGEHRIVADHPDREALRKPQILRGDTEFPKHSIPLLPLIEKPEIEVRQDVVDGHQLGLDRRSLMLATIAAYGFADGFVEGFVAEMDDRAMERKPVAAGVPALQKFGDETGRAFAAFDTDEPAELAAHEAPAVHGDRCEKRRFLARITKLLDPLDSRFAGVIHSAFSSSRVERKATGPDRPMLCSVTVIRWMNQSPPPVPRALLGRRRVSYLDG
jgi:hypothetical protein